MKKIINNIASSALAFVIGGILGVFVLACCVAARCLVKILMEI